MWLENLSEKLVTLLALVTGRRIKTLSLIDLRYLKKFRNKIGIQSPTRIERPGRRQPLLVHPFLSDENVFSAFALQSYIN